MGFIVLPQKKRIRVKQPDTKRLQKIRNEHKKWLEENNISREQLRSKLKDFGYDLPKYKVKVKMPATSDRIVPMKGKQDPQAYSGERKLLGIFSMHKSNLVPVFDKESAEDIAKMRRN